MDVAAEAVAEAFTANPVAADEEPAQEDTNAVLSPFFPEWRLIGRVLGVGWLRKALELGTLAPSESDAEVAAAAFAARLAATAEEDLRQKWSSTPRVEGTTRPTAARRAAVSVRSPGGTKHSWNLGADDADGSLFSPGREPAETPVARRQ